ncbi:MAG: MBL fold metallo-hydrolase [Deltaproteobacteria bacterium]|nr:MBL fold metallo-hydrolase [Deltaproteobacteria bacterium]
MIHRSITTKIADNLYCLGPEEMPTYLLDGEVPTMFDAGISGLGEHYATEVRNILGARPLHYLFLSHVHFDHCGSTGYLRQVYPDVTICASSISAEIISKPSALKLIGKLSAVPGMTEAQKFKTFTIDRIIEDGDSIDLHENGVLRAVATPGHTRDMTSFYLPQLRTLIPSEAAGVPAGNGHIYSEFLVDYEAYFSSINRLANLDFERILCAHRCFYDGEDAAGYFEDAIDQTIGFKDRIAELLAEYPNNHETVGRIIKAEEYEQVPEPKLPEPAYDLNLAAKINAVSRLLGIAPN